MTAGVIITALGVVCYFLNVLLIRKYLKKRSPEDFDLEGKINDMYAWEYTAGLGIVPKWVSFIGIIAMILIPLGVIIIIVSFFL